MQRVLLVLSTLFALYACTPTLPYKPGQEKPAAPVSEAEIPAPETVTAPEIAPEAVTPEILEPIIVDKARAIPHIALLLPLRSPIFGPSASSVERGFMAAARQDGQVLPIQAYDNFDENNSVVSVYRQAVSNGALAVVGPITRNGVTALAESRNTPVPTLSLNVVDTAPVQNLYYFGMAIESEARQIARLARRQGLHQAIIITTGEQLSKRLQSAFEYEWNASGGTILREIEFGDNTSIFADITEIPGTMIFIATDARKARLIRPYLSNRLPDYATSRVFLGNSDTLLNYDLNGIRFVDMPWLLQPDHPAVMIYPRSNPPLSADNERLYALGIDAYRLIRLMLFNRLDVSLPLDGVSGQINLIGHTFQRTASPAVFAQGQAQLAGAPIMPPIQMFPEQPVGNQ
jgi:outer membrane PBP1 activator LpoA protein